MRTEDLVPGPRQPDARGLSFLDRPPPEWHITDARDRRVELSLAGHVLHFRRPYKVWVAPLSENGPLPQIRILSRPTWMTEGEQHAVEKHGRKYACLKFHVRRLNSWFFWEWLKEIYSDDVKIELEVAAPGGSERRTICCPIVARSPWYFSLIVFGILGASFFTLLEVVVKQIAAGFWSTGSVPDGWAFSWELTALVLLSPVIAFAITFWQLTWHLFCRRRELHRQFRERWPSVNL